MQDYHVGRSWIRRWRVLGVLGVWVFVEVVEWKVRREEEEEEEERACVC